MLGRERPAVFLHHPLIMKSADQKLSKSDRDTGVRDLRAIGWTVGRVLDAAGGDGGHGTGFKNGDAETRRRMNVSWHQSAADAGPAVGRAERSIDRRWYAGVHRLTAGDRRHPHRTQINSVVTPCAPCLRF